MLTTMDGSPACSSTTAFTQPPSCTSPDPSSTTEQQREPATSPNQDFSCAKHPSSRAKYSQRHTPYPADTNARSPGSCSSDGESVSDGDVTQDGMPRHTKVKRVAANSRERKRMHTVNSAFDQLRELVPTYPSNRKLSKIDTLRLACTYIQDLVSLLHNTQSIQGEDVLYHQPFPAEGFNTYPVPIKQEDYPPFTTTQEPFRMQPTCLRFPAEGCPESYPSSASASESDSATHSPPHHFMQQVPQPIPPPPLSAAITATAVSLSSRPPPLTRVNSEGTSSIHTQMAETTISGNGQQVPTMSTPLSLPPPPPTSMYQRQVNITSPLAMHSVHHSSTTTPNLLQNGLGASPPPPVWQRATALPTGYALYGQ